MQRGVVQSLPGDFRAPERLRRRGSTRLDLLGVRVLSASVGIRAVRDEHLHHGGVHARGGGVHGAVPEPPADDAGGDKVGVGAALEQDLAAFEGVGRVRLGRGDERGSPGPSRDAVDVRAGG